MNGASHAPVPKQEFPPAMVGSKISTSAPKVSPALNTYRNEEYLNLSPVEVIKKLYDVAIVGCKKNDQTLVRRSINELIAALNFEQQDVSLGLYRLYDYCKYQVRQGHPLDAVSVLEELRSTWMKAFNLK